MPQIEDRTRKLKRHILKCDVCRQTFVATRPHALACSDRCRTVKCRAAKRKAA